jgi:uncharacterized protein (DUF1800 family)
MRYLFFLIYSVPLFIQAQFYEDYIGAGHAEGVIVTSSDELQVFGQSFTASGANTINGQGMDAKFMEAVRFMNQASLGADQSIVQEVMDMGFEAWLDAQADLEPSYLHPQMITIIDEAIANYIAQGGDPENYFSPGPWHFQYAWWQINMTNEDLLRQRVAYALSQILVTSYNSNLSDRADGIAYYYDVLVEHALGNYQDLLLDVSLHPAMGLYLSHFNNPRNIDDLNIHPDENYAREVMQLFSIGLYELNIDGTQTLDGNGDPIPTYGLDEVKELAEVFTGLGPGAMVPNPFDEIPNFGDSWYFTDFGVSMAMYEEWHEPGQKNLVNGGIVPAGQTGMEDIEDAVEILFTHPNVGPFLATRLIQHLVKSNPTPSYVQRVAQVFNDNGNGVRGDLHATVKAILLDEEARDCEWISEPFHGKLTEPFCRYTQFSRMSDVLAEEERYWNAGYAFLESTEQAPMNSKSVFNFFQPTYQPNGPIADAGLVAPEFQIHNSLSSIAYMNQVNDWTFWWALMYSWEEAIEPVFVDIAELEELAKSPEVLINELDKLYLRGQMSDGLREILRTSMEAFQGSTVGPLYLDYRARMAQYLILISPDYAILR